MCAVPCPDKLRARFQAELNAAIAMGRTPPPATGLGPTTLAAVAQVAREHPEASVEHIAHACDAFAAEHNP